MINPKSFNCGAFGRRFSWLAGILAGWLACCALGVAGDTAPGPNTFPPVAFENVKDYGMMWWRSGWRGERVWQIKTSRHYLPERSAEALRPPQGDSPMIKL